MTFVGRLFNFIAERFRNLSLFEIGLFKMSMFFMGVFAAACMPRRILSNKKLLGALAAVFTGSFLGYFMFGERYFELGPTLIKDEQG